MKKHILILVVLMLGIFVFEEARCEFQRTKIAVLDFQIQGKGFETEDMGKIVAEWLITALVQKGRFDVIERRLLEKVLKEQNLGASGVVDSASASKIGKVLGARIVVSGSVIRLSKFTEVNARLIDVASGSILAAEKVKSQSTTRLEDLITMMSDKIMNDFPLEGYIVQRSGDSVIIDLGKRAGVKKGMKFIVFKEGKLIKHPKTGEVLDIELIRTGEVQVKRVKEKTSTANITSDAEGQKIEYGQMVRSASVKNRVGVYNPPPEPVRTETRAQTGSRSSSGPADGFRERVNAIDAKLEEATQLKEDGNAAWKDKMWSAFTDTKKIFRAHARDPEVYMLLAKCYWLNNRLSKAEKSLRKAFYFKADHADSHIFRGDMYFHEAKNARGEAVFTEHRARGKFGTYRSYSKESYESALNSSSMSDQEKAKVHFKLGKVYASLYNSPEKAKEHWDKAVSLAPGSKWAKKAKNRMSEVN